MDAIPPPYPRQGFRTNRWEARAAYQQGLEVATRNGDLQTVKEIEVFLRRLEYASPRGRELDGLITDRDLTNAFDRQDG